MIIQQFLHWVRTAQTTDREEATYALVRAYLRGDLAQETPALVDAAMTVLLDDESALVRRALALALADSEKAPRHIILGLAADQPDVAGPVLRQSPKFMDGELIDIVIGREEKIQQAVAERKSLSPMLARAIAEHAGSKACLSLLHNANVQMPSECVMLIAERHGANAEIHKALRVHSRASIRIRHTLVAKLAESLKDMASSRNWMPRERSERVTQDSLEQATVEMLFDCDDADLPRFVAFLGERRHLTSALLLRAITSGRISFFIVALSLLADVPEERVYGLLEDGRESNFHAIYERAGLPQAAYRAFFIALDVYKQIAEPGYARDPVAFRQRMLDTVIEHYSRQATLIGDKIIVFLHRLAAEASRDAARVNAQSALQQLADEEGWQIDMPSVDTHGDPVAGDSDIDADTYPDTFYDQYDDQHWPAVEDMDGYSGYASDGATGFVPAVPATAANPAGSGFGKRRQRPAIESAA